MRFRDYVKSTGKYDQFVRRLSDICAKRAYVLRTIGRAGQYDLYVVSANEGAERTVAFIGTVHGDEIAGAWSILTFLEKADFPKDVRILALPMGNPRGYERDTHAGTGRLNINRQFSDVQPEYEARFIKELMTTEKIDFFHSIHEDEDGKGFYLYYQDKGIRPEMEDIIEIAKKHMSVDPRHAIYGDPNQHGEIFVDKKAAQHDRDNLETWLYVHAGINYVCTETPSTLPLEQRVACENEIMQYVVQNLDRLAL